MNTQRQIEKLVLKLTGEGGLPLPQVAAILLSESLSMLGAKPGGDAMLVSLSSDGKALFHPNDKITETLEKAGDQFLLYERHHLDKGTEESREKAIVNREMAVLCYTVIGRNMPDFPEGDPDYIPTSYDSTIAPTHGDADVILYVQAKARTAAKRGLGDTARVLDNLADDLAQGLHVGLEDPHKALIEITQMIGESNVKAGWWSDTSIDLRNCPYSVHVFGTKLALVHSEVSEALEGHRKSKKGAVLMDDHLPEYPMVAVEIADAHIRLFDLGANYRTPDGDTIDVPGALIAKLAYNANRLDHKPEHRAAAGGKTV